jgi:hypothetical protein
MLNFELNDVRMVVFMELRVVMAVALGSFSVPEPLLVRMSCSVCLIVIVSAFGEELAETLVRVFSVGFRTGDVGCETEIFDGGWVPLLFDGVRKFLIDFMCCILIILIKCSFWLSLFV